MVSVIINLDRKRLVFRRNSFEDLIKWINDNLLELLIQPPKSLDDNNAVNIDYPQKVVIST